MPFLPASSTTPPAAFDWRRCVQVSLLTALAYVVVGRLALLLAIPPGFASPLYPGAGLALAAVLVYGRLALPGVALGAWTINILLTGARDVPASAMLGLPLVSALGAALQAQLGARLVRWRLPGPLMLGELREVATFYTLGALLACTVNASLSTLALSLAGVLPAGLQAFTWWTWWAGDTLGVLIGAPIVLTLIGQPRPDWAVRRITLGLPLLVVTLLLAGATALVAHWDTQRATSTFERDAATTADAVERQLQHAQFALEGIHGLFIGSDDVTADELGRVATPWLALPIQLQALGYSERVPRSALGPFEAAAVKDLGRPYRVFDRTAPGQPSSAAQDSDVVAIRMIEPREPNAMALGVNALSIPAAREAILRSAASDRPAASVGFRLTQEPGDQTGVVIYRALYHGTPQAVDRAKALRAVVFVTLRMQQSIEAAMREVPAYLRWCLVDHRPGTLRPRLAGPAGCELAGAGQLHHASTVELGGQQWQLHIDTQLAQVPDVGYGNAWLFSTVGLLSAAMLAALLLTVTGRTRRIEVAVAERTADLQHEVLERQRTESALRESEQRFRNIFDHAPVGIIYADLAGQVREANPRLRELIGYDAEALAQRSIADLTHPDDRAEQARGLARLLAGELSEVRHRGRLQHHDGQRLWVQMSWSVVRNLLGQAQRLLVVVEDITEQLKREEAEQGRQLAESANQAKNDFLSRMSHELRTPLNAMLGFGQLLDLDRRPRLATHQLGWVAQILQAGWHLLEMINDTLDLSRIEAGMLRLALAPVALQPLVAHCVAMVEPAAARRGIRLQVDLADDMRFVQGDETRLKQVMTNLLSNAVKYNVPGGRVAVSARHRDAHTLEIRVLDTGLGLSPEQMADLFQPFNRLGREQSEIEGTGIGLVISRRLVELMGGELRAESTEGEGATFVLTLPVAAAGLPAPVLTRTEHDAADRYRHRQVHYVEDNDTNVEVMRGILAQRPQVLLSVSALGLDGLTTIRARRPDLILLDMHLPDIDGLELLRQLQRDPVCADIPVVVVSADATPARIEEALAAGARHYLTKPLNLAGFLSVLDELLEGMDTRFG